MARQSMSRALVTLCRRSGLDSLTLQRAGVAAHIGLEDKHRLIGGLKQAVASSRANCPTAGGPRRERRGGDMVVGNKARSRALSEEMLLVRHKDP